MDQVMSNNEELENDAPITKEELLEKVKREKANKASVFTQEIQLPSNGYFGAPKSVRIRRMTTAEEKILYTSVDSSYITDICRSCCTSWDLDIDKLAPADIICMIFAIRNITFGNFYSQEVICPDCGTKSKVQVDITSMPIDILDEENIEKLSAVKLPDSGQVVIVNMLTEGEIKRIDKKVKKLAKKANVPESAIDFEEKFKAMIRTVDGEVLEDLALTKYLNEMSARDYNAIRNSSTNLVKSFGLDRTILYKCKNCRMDEEVTAVIVPEFFRPNESDLT